MASYVPFWASLISLAARPEAGNSAEGLRLLAESRCDAPLPNWLGAPFQASASRSRELALGPQKYVKQLPFGPLGHDFMYFRRPASCNWNDV